MSPGDATGLNAFAPNYTLPSPAVSPIKPNPQPSINTLSSLLSTKSTAAYSPAVPNYGAPMGEYDRRISYPPAHLDASMSEPRLLPLPVATLQNPSPLPGAPTLQTSAAQNAHTGEFVQVRDSIEE